MQTPLGRRRLSGALVAAVGIAAFGGSLMLAEASFAAAPATSAGCVPADGKINGRGSTFQNNAQAAFLAGFQSDYCGQTPSSGGDVAGSLMGAYNYGNASTLSLTGSGAGIKAMNCRTDAFAGTDVPYTNAQLALLDGTPGDQTSIGGCSTGLSPLPAGFLNSTGGPPFPPDFATNAVSGSSVFPSASDQPSPMMAVPVAGSSVTVIVNIPVTTNCPSGAPAGLNLTGSEVSNIMGGSDLFWDASDLVANNSGLTGCHEPIQRVVRADSSGTTTIFKSYLQNADPTRSTATCAPGKIWSTDYNTPPGGILWPQTGDGGTCSANVVMGASSGNPALVLKVSQTPDSVGYADLADAINDPGASSLLIASVRNGVNTNYVSPLAGSAANCDLSTVIPPGTSPSDKVGLNAGNNWSQDNATANGTGNHVDITDKGAKYPICGLTFDMVYSNLGQNNAISGHNAIAALTADQRRTLYSYFTYMLSSSGQNLLGGKFYAPLSPILTSQLTTGFQQNY